MPQTYAKKEAFDIRGFLSNIPGLKLPSKEQAVGILQAFIRQKGSASEKIIDQVISSIR